MSANINPIFTLTPNCGAVSIEALNSARDGSGTLVTVITAGANGGIIYGLYMASAQATLAAFATKVVNIFKINAAGTSKKLVGSVLMTGATPSTILISVEYSKLWINGLALKAGESIAVCQTVYNTVADKTDVYADAWDY
jgi:hypothetical protein